MSAAATEARKTTFWPPHASGVKQVNVVVETDSERWEYTDWLVTDGEPLGQSDEDGPDSGQVDLDFTDDGDPSVKGVIIIPVLDDAGKFLHNRIYIRMPKTQPTVIQEV